MHPLGTEFAATRVSGVPGRPEVRIDYSAREAFEESRPRHVTCVFGGAGEAHGRPELTAIETAWAAYFGPAMREVALFAVLVAVLVLRPGGLFGLATPKPRDV